MLQIAKQNDINAKEKNKYVLLKQKKTFNSPWYIWESFPC